MSRCVWLQRVTLINSASQTARGECAPPRDRWSILMVFMSQVISALQKIFCKYGQQSEDNAAKLVKEMTHAGRLVQELWS